jgi:hypothetical protein
MAAPLAAGELIAALAVDEGPHHAPDRISDDLQGRPAERNQALRPDGMAADMLVVAADSAGRAGADPWPPPTRPDCRAPPAAD